VQKAASHCLRQAKWGARFRRAWKKDKDGSTGFDFAGTYTRVIPHERIDHAFGDRVAHLTFAGMAEGVNVVVMFGAEQTHSEQQQPDGWQAILDNFRQYVEAQPR
jgi:uncharacterized protein YndB with AHSA1/START domain